MAIDLILGTAGHIDHGKTALVRALTGTDTDRLPEEKKRGITIELGFAELTLAAYQLGIVDVPGHERFVRTMLAGATGIDLALLVVAADDSVKPQTNEHLDILRLLGLRHGVIALTKCDVADTEWVDLVEAEVADLVADTFLADAELIRTSARTGQGIDDLKAALVRVADRAVGRQPQQRVAGPFRMPVDRTFSAAGHGTIVTGSVLRGRARVGSELELHPANRRVRVRALQNHERDVEEVHRGQRAAVNLAGVDHHEVSRGCELAEPGLLSPSQLLTVELTMLPSARRPLKNRRRIRVHLGTDELMATVSLRGGSEVAAGQTELAQLFLAEPVTTTWGQPFVIRSESPMVTIGGGRVLVPSAWKFRRGAERDWQQVQQLQSDDVLDRAAAAVYFCRFDDWQPVELARSAGAEDPQRVCEQLLGQEGVIQQMVVSPTRTIRVHCQQAEQLRESIEAALQRLHDDNPRDLVFDASRLAAKFRYLDDGLLYKAILVDMVATGRVEETPRGVALPGRGPQLSKNERKLLELIVVRYQQAGLRPPSVAEVTRQAERNQSAVPQLITLAAARGDLVPLSDELYLHCDTERLVRRRLAESFPGDDGFTVSQVRELLDVSRKYAIPLCEYFDRIGFTRRNGDLRVVVDADATKTDVAT